MGVPHEYDRIASEQVESLPWAALYGATVCADVDSHLLGLLPHGAPQRRCSGWARWCCEVLSVLNFCQWGEKSRITPKLCKWESQQAQR